MASVNKVILVGNLGRDPEVRYMPNGDAVANYSIATTETWKDKNGMRQEKTEWHNIVMYRRLAEIAGEYLKKGSSVYIEGRLQTRKWQDKQGNDRYTTEIVADQMQMLGGRNSGGGDGGGNRPGALQGAAQGEGEQIMRASGHKAAQGKHRQPAVNHLFAADAVGQHAQRQLQQGLRQPVAAQRQANPGGVVAAGQLMGVQGKHRQDKKHAQHAQGVDAGKPQACP